jgi:glycine cleavage system regulatory protein
VSLEAFAGKKETFATTVLKPDGTPQPLTNATVWFMAKRSRSDPDVSAVINKQAAIIDAALGTIEVRLTAADTVGILGDFTALYYDVQVKDTGTNEVQVTESGMLYIYGPVRLAAP